LARRERCHQESGAQAAPEPAGADGRPHEENSGSRKEPHAMNTDERLNALERELGRTKRVNRWLLAVIGVIVVAGFTALTVTRQETRVATEVRARAFVVEDANGKMRAVLGVVEDGVPTLALFDANGNMRVTVGGVDKDGDPWLVLSNANGKGGAVLGVPTDGGPALSLHGANGKTRARLWLSNDGSPALSLHDANGVSFWTTPIKRTP
jgi:hypothetical protein